MKIISLHRKSFLIAGLSLFALVVWGFTYAFARQPAAPAQQASPLHPTFALLDSSGVNVLESGQPVSTMQTCGQCHDAAYIESHSFHADLGLSAYQPGSSLNASNGLFGKWNPITYRYLSQPGDERLDLTTAGWLMMEGERIPGGGPATTSRSGIPLQQVAPRPFQP